jgi:hypothetical protein
MARRRKKPNPALAEARQLVEDMAVDSFLRQLRGAEFAAQVDIVPPAQLAPQAQTRYAEYMQQATKRGGGVLVVAGPFGVEGFLFYEGDEPNLSEIADAFRSEVQREMLHELGERPTVQ